MKAVRVLDAAHVLAVCAYAAPAGAGSPDPERIEVTASAETVRVRFADQARQAAALQALHAVGYDATSEATTITVRGWSHARLSDRVARLDKAMQWLVDQLAFTARQATDLYREATADGQQTDRAARELARREVVAALRKRVQDRVGPLLRQFPYVHPDDARARSLLNQSWCLEDEADLLLGRHRALATQAIAEDRIAHSRTEQPVHIATRDLPAEPITENTEPGEQPAADVVPLEAPATQPGAPTAPRPGRGA